MNPKSHEALWATELSTYFAPEDARAVATALFVYYSAPNRFYHDYNHITDMLILLDTARRKGCEIPDWVSIAVIFHDAIYETSRKDNEFQSAELFRRLSESLEVTLAAQSMFKPIYEAIMDTLTHVPSNNIPGLQEFLDADMAPLAVDYPQFLENTIKISKEYSQYSPENFSAGRVAFLKSVQYPIFKSEAFAHLEAPAKANIKKYIKEMEGTK